MTSSATPPAWEMVGALTEGRLVTPPLGSSNPGQINAFDKWHWGTRELDRMRDLYLFDVEAVARNIIEHGPLFSLSHGGHGINSYALSLVTTAPSGDVAFFTQHGLWGAYSDENNDVARINDAYQRVAREWAELADGPLAERVRWLVYSSDLRSETGIVDLDALRRCGAEAAIERIEPDALFDELKARRAAADPPPPQLFEIVPHLAAALRQLEDDAHLVIGVHGSTRYVQFAAFWPNLRLETIGPRYLEQAGEALSVDQLVWLADRGWHDADDGGNLWREWKPADEDAAATAAMDVLHKVHGVTSLDEVWFESPNDELLSILEGYSPAPKPMSEPGSPGMDPDTFDSLVEAINARRARVEERHLPLGNKVVAVVDYVDHNAVLDVLGLVGDQVFRRHDADWHEDPEWRTVLPTAPARSIASMTQDQFVTVLLHVDRSTAGKPWKPFKVADCEQYWPSHRPNDPDLFDWTQLHCLDDLHEM